MTQAGETTDEDREWATEFIRKNFEEYYREVMCGYIPKGMPDWENLFHMDWTANLSSKTYDKGLWMRRNAALKYELKNAYARFIQRNASDDTLEKVMKLLAGK